MDMHNIVNSNNAPTVDQNDRLVVRGGMFYMCYKAGNAPDQSALVPNFPFKTDLPPQRCYFVDRQCLLPKLDTPLMDCDEFNGIRALGILALLFAAIAFFHQGAYARGSMRNVTRHTGKALAYLSASLGLISMALALDYYDQMPTNAFGYSFWLLVIAWPFVAVGGSLFSSAVHQEEPELCQAKPAGSGGAKENGVELANRGDFKSRV